MSQAANGHQPHRPSPSVWWRKTATVLPWPTSMTGSRAPRGPTSCRKRRSARLEPQRAVSAAAELDWVEVEVVGTGCEDGGVDAEPPVPQPTKDSSTAAAARTPGFPYVRTNIAVA